MNLRPTRKILAALILSVGFFHSGNGFAQAGYYLLGNQTVELREVVPTGQGAETVDFKGGKLTLSKTPVIASSEIEGILVETDPDGGRTDLNMQFKVGAWEKIHQATGKAIGKQIVLLKGGKAFQAPRMMAALTSSGSFILDPDLVKEFLSGMQSATPPTLQAKKAQELAYYEAQVKKNPQDLQAKEQLAGLYTNGDTAAQAKAATLYESMVQQDPTRLDFYSSGAKFYLASNQPDKAVALIQKALTRAGPETQWPLHAWLAQIYKAQGKKDLALQEYQTALKTLRATQPSTEQILAAQDRLMLMGLDKVFPGMTEDDWNLWIKKIEGEIALLQAGSANNAKP